MLEHVAVRAAVRANDAKQQPLRGEKRTLRNRCSNRRQLRVVNDELIESTDRSGLGESRFFFSVECESADQSIHTAAATVTATAPNSAYETSTLTLPPSADSDCTAGCWRSSSSPGPGVQGLRGAGQGGRQAAARAQVVAAGRSQQLVGTACGWPRRTTGTSTSRTASPT